MRKLYYEDCHLSSFSAVVTSCTPTEKGYEVTVDQTAFYPEGGGQACDLGTLGDAAVLDVRECGEDVIHLCSSPLQPGQTVQGHIQWDRRFDLMQQHTGEHLLSGLIHHRYGYHNSGFHVGAEVMEVDFDGVIPMDDLWELEYEANRLVWANLPVRCYVPAPDALSQISYRTKRELPWPVRIVEIPGGDTCACCGVHVGFTGEVGLIKILSCVRLRGGVRLEMVCGRRAYRHMQSIFLENRQVSQLLSSKMHETALAVQKLSDSLCAEKYRAAGLEKKLFQAVADSYRGQADILHFAEALTPGGVRELAEAIAEVCTGTAAVCSGSDETGYSLCLVSRCKNVQQLGARAAASLNGRGGGRDCAFQGTVKASREEIVRFWQAL